MPVQFILNRLNEYGYEGYIVGGCVRDYIMGLKPHDWDICTAASPEQVMELFKDFKVIPTGIQHGTVSIVFEDVSEPFNVYEITTYRIDGEYKDNRHPENVEFVSQLELDLARRDFTINAMAYNEEKGLVDLYGGVEDIKNKVIRCVGNPSERFQEDALRIMRALRFAIRFGFSIDKATFSAARDNINLIKNVSVERICAELTKIFDRQMYNVLDVDDAKVRMKTFNPLYNFVFNIIELILPEGMYSANRYTLSRLWYANSPHLEVNLAIIFDRQNYVDILKYLRFSNEIIDAISDIHTYGHQIAEDYPKWADIENKRASVYYARKLLHNIKKCPSFLVTDFAKAIIIEDKYFSEDNSKFCDQKIYGACTLMLELTINDCRNNQDVFDLKYMAINGNDLLQIGFEGKQIGKILNELLDLVMQDKVKNKRKSLLEAITDYKLSESD